MSTRRCLGGVALVVMLGLASSSLRADFDANGWLLDWLYAGPLVQSGGATPGIEALRADYLSNGIDVFESTVLPMEGDPVAPDFFNSARSEGIHPVILIPSELAWIPVRTTDIPGNTIPDTLDVLLLHAAAAVDNAMVYAVAYVRNPGAEPIEATLQVSSDDALQVKLDDCEVLMRNVGGGVGVAGTVRFEEPVTIEPGAHRLMVKVFQGAGGVGLRLRFVDRTTQTPLGTPDLEVSIDPDEFADLDAPIPTSGISAVRTITPDKVVGTDTPLAVGLTIAKVDPSLSDDAQITVRETLPSNMSVVAGSATPPVSSTDGSTSIWELSVAEATLSGIQYEIELSEALPGTLNGTVAVGEEASCELVTAGTTAVFAVKANAIFVGDIVGGGSGRGDKDPNIWGINNDTGFFMTEAEIRGANGNTLDADGINPSPVVDTDLVDSVFLLNQPTLAINSAGAQYTFQPNDDHPNSYNHILSNLTNDVDKSPGNIRVGGVEGYATGVGIHASAGVTLDLDAIRDEHGADRVVTLSTLVGTDGCGLGTAGNNTVRLYILYSDEDGVISDWFHEFTGADQVVAYQEPIPEDAMFLTFATGDVNNAIGCDHGVFAETRIFPELPTARITADPPSGGAPLAVNFSAADSTAPAGATLVQYDWDFGDGSSATGETVSHTFQARGRYTVTLTIADSAGFSDFETLEIQALFQGQDVSPWVSEDLGDPATHGGAQFVGDCLQVFAGGTGLGRVAGDPDSMHFVHLTKSGDAAITARIETAAFDASGDAGVMIRTGPEANAPFAYLGLRDVGGVLRAYFYRREVLGERARVGRSVALTSAPPDFWVRLERTGDTFQGFISIDGSEWTQEDNWMVDIVGAPAETRLGLAVMANATATLPDATADITFCTIDTGDGPPPGKTFHRGDPNDDGTINITDGVYVLNYLFLGGASPTCMESADPNDDGTINITDGVYILNYLFLGGTEPAPPGGVDSPCGADPQGSPADLGCDSYTGC